MKGDPSDDEFAVPELTPSPDVPVARMASRRELLAGLEGGLGGVPNGTHGDHDAFRARALGLLDSPVAGAFRVDREPESTRDAYGRTRYGQSLLLARRLVEAGTRVACVSMTPIVNGRWDTHNGGFKALRDELLPELDAGLSGLIADLADRRLLGRTLVAAIGEFGRTPRVDAGNARYGGRDHWSRCYTLLLAGGGIRGGYVHGASDRLGADPSRDPVSPGDVVATLYAALGIPADTELRDALGRPFRLVHRGAPIPELFS